MINIFRMDLHRFQTNKLMYALLLVFFAFQIFGIFMLDKYEPPGGQGGIPVSSMNESQLIQLMLGQPPSWMLIYIAVFSVFFYMSEYSSGFYKNYISIKNARMYSVFSKIFILGLFTALIFIVMVVADLISRFMFFNHATIGDGLYFTKLIIGQFLLHWAFAIVVLCIAMISKSSIAGIVIGLALALNTPGMIVGALESLIGDVNLSSYMLVNTIVTAKDFDNPRDVIHVASVAMLSILLFSFVAVRYKLKEDLK